MKENENSKAENLQLIHLQNWVAATAGSKKVLFMPTRKL